MLCHFHLSVLIILSNIVPYCEPLTCSNSTTHQYLNGECIFVLGLSQLIKPMQWAEDECMKLDEYPVQWHLPTPNSVQKHEALSNILHTSVRTYDFFDESSIYFWIGLKREEGDPELDYNNMTRWSDPTKWRWILDGSSLNETFPAGKIPWERDEPNNYQRSDQRCVYAHRAHMLDIFWYDHSCETPDMWPKLDMLVCESRTSPQTSLSKRVAIGMSVVVILTIIATIAGFLIIRHRQNRMNLDMVALVDDRRPD